ncbi:reverse transcriptase domain-containing protein [Tanacetum coccineum]
MRNDPGPKDQSLRCKQSKKRKGLKRQSIRSSRTDRQKKRGQAAERNVAINDEVSKLVKAGIMREVHYHDWLSNPVMVKKSDNSWRMCVDLKTLIKACPKDVYRPHAENRLEGRIFVWIPLQMLPGCIQGVSSNTKTEEDKGRERPQGRRCIKPSVTKMLERRAEVKWKIGELKQVLSKVSGEIITIFQNFEKMHKKSDFLWTEEAEAAFKQMKEHIAKLPMLTAPEEQEELIVYLAASKEAVSAVLMTEREARQMPIYFVSRVLQGPEINYTAMEKLVLALVHASKRLKRYFQTHPITVITDQPIKNILSNPKVAGRMQKWSIQLGEFGIHYRPRVFVKGQVLADFIVERPEDKGHDNSPNEEEPLPAWWTLFTDGSSCVDGCRAGVILTDPEGMEFTHALRF